MKIILRLIVVLFTFSRGFAQQIPHYTQYVMNNFILNPAISGIENYTDIKLSARDQWLGISGAPKSSYITIHAPIGKSDYRTNVTSFEMKGDNPIGKSYWENYTATEPHHGIGLVATNDMTGSYSHFKTAVTYAYHIGLNYNTNLSVGFAAGISKFSIDRNKNNFGFGNAFDPATGTSTDKELFKIKPDLAVGLWLYSKDYFLGLAVQQVIPQKILFNNNYPSSIKGRLIPHSFLTLGYRFLLNEDINAIPSMMLKYIKGSSNQDFQIETNLKLQYHDLIWLGVSYRINDGYAAMFGFKFANNFNFGYSYDLTRSLLKTVSNGTHEIILGILLGNSYSSKCPRANW